MPSHHLIPTPDSVHWGKIPNRSTRPILSVASGDTVVFDTLSHEGLLEDQGRDPVRYFQQFGIPSEEVLPDAIALAASPLPHDFDKDGVHILLGPVHVAGAESGDVLQIDVLSLQPRVRYGVVSNRQQRGALPGEFPERLTRLEGACPERPERYGNVSVFMPIQQEANRWVGVARQGDREIVFPLNPFLGTMGVVPDSDDNWHSAPPARIGGNLDINELGAGSTLYLPVEVSGALFFAGDPHFAQGDGEVALSALEGSLSATLRLSVLKQGNPAIPPIGDDGLRTPFAETKTHWLAIGLDEDLNEAMRMAVRQSVEFLSRRFGIARHLAYAYCSAAVDYEVSQVVDMTKGVHGLIRKADFASFLSS